MSYGPERVIPSRDLRECAVCGRFFTLDRLNTHEVICQNSSVTKRKSFDISQQRVRGTDTERMATEAAEKECSSGLQKSGPCGLFTKWRIKHEDFINKVKEAKGHSSEQNKKVNDLPFPPLMDQNADYVQCPHCSRQFNQPSALRHISICVREMPKSKTNFTE